jgi:chaperone BCS1
MSKLSRELRAVTFDRATTPVTDASSRDHSNPTSDRNDTGTIVGTSFNFQKWYGEKPLIYKPNSRSRYLCHGGIVFHWSSGQRPSICGEGYDRFIVIRCLGRSTKPIKDLLHEVKSFTPTKGRTTTEIYRSSIKDEDGQWLRQSIRPSRPMYTVSLDQQQEANQLGVGAEVALGVKATRIARNKSLISLAGLLKIIDGAAAQEVSGYDYSFHQTCQQSSGLQALD